MERVSFKVAKAIREAGYPQNYEKDSYTNLNGGIWVKPTYMEVWLWLWKEKGIFIDVDHRRNEIVSVTIYTTDDYITELYENTPEEAIIAAINYLVENDLIK